VTMFKFALDMDTKLGQKRSWRVTWPTFWNFGTPCIYRERLKLERSNLAHRLATGGPNEKMQN